MFWLILCAVVLVVLPVVLRIFAEEGPDGGVVHLSGEDGDSTGDDDPDIMLAAGTGEMAA